MTLKTTSTPTLGISVGAAPIKKKKRVLGLKKKTNPTNPTTPVPTLPTPETVHIVANAPGLGKKRFFKQTPTLQIPTPEAIAVAEVPPTAPPPPPPPILCGHTPKQLVEIWEAKIPWLKSFVEIPPIGVRQSYYAVVDPGDHADFSSLSPIDPIDATPEYGELGKKMWRDRLLPKQIGNQYYFTKTTKIFTPTELSRVAAQSKPVGFMDLTLHKEYSSPYQDLRTKLFSLLAGMYELQFGYDPEFFALLPENLPPKMPTSFNPAPWTRDGLAWEAHTTPQRCFNNVLGNWFSATTGVPYANRNSYYDAKKFPLSISPKLEITPTLAASLSADDLKLGCNPSENIYGLAGDLGLASLLPTRWAGGHVHVGLPANRINPATIQKCIRNIDAIAGVALVNMVGDWDDTQRRQFYGQAGEYRSKPYGFEYRTPSNQMWTSSFVAYAFLEVMRMAAKMALANLDYEDIGFNTTEDEIIRIIQDNNKPLAKAVVERNLPIYAAIFESKSNFAYQAFGPLSVILREGECKTLSRDRVIPTKQSLANVFGDRKQLSYLTGDWPHEYSWAKIS